MKSSELYRINLVFFVMCFIANKSGKNIGKAVQVTLGKDIIDT